MIVYSYDGMSGYFNGILNADESPLEIGVYHMPANTTTTKHPDFLFGQIPRWIGTEWIIEELPDYVKDKIMSCDIDLQTWSNVRFVRNKMLIQSDWTQIPDCSVKNKKEWKSYRKKLRDITTDYQHPTIVKWPIKPD